MKKTFLIAAALFFSFSSSKLAAQQYGNFLGSGGNHTPTPEEIAAAEAQRRQKVQALLNGHYLRRVNGHIVNMFLNGNLISLRVESKIDGFIIGNGGNSHEFGRFAVKNYTGDAIADKYIDFVAVKNGTYDNYGTPVELYDCGEILSPAEEQKEVCRSKDCRSQCQSS